MDRSPVLNTAGAESEDLMCDSVKCYICLDPFEKQTVGSLENCQHVFCLECILQWSQTANTCPVDRISFTLIYQRRSPGDDVQKKIKVSVRKNEDGGDEEEGSSAAVICEECGRGDRRHRLLVCILCDSGYHMHCLRPTLNTRPEGDWVCPECAVTAHVTESSLTEEEISDGELTDLLAEVEEIPSTSSRLRPSSTNRPSSSTERRRSARIQNRGDSRPSYGPQTSWHVPKYLLRTSKPPVPADKAHNQSESSHTSVKIKRRKKGRRKRAA